MAGVLAAFARDVVHAVALILRVGFFATPVMYDAALLPDAFAWSSSVNPVGVAITAIRDIIFCRTMPDLPLLGIQLVAGVAAVGLAMMYVQRVERRVPDVI
jgi:ABC-type polysaccharide/polyol phosphate export permease